MKNRGVKIAGRLAAIAFAVFCFAGMFVRCASTAAPQGGPRDTLPPVVVRMTPEDMTTEFKGRRIYIEFDEYVRLNSLTKEFFVSPELKRMPTVTVRGRGIQIDIHPSDTLEENTTYAFNFGSSVADNNEGNPLNGFRYVFSTGPQIDSLVMSGYTVDAYRKDSVSNTLIFFYDAALDSVAIYDSTLFKTKPEVIGRAFPNGIFFTQNLKPKDYRVYAVADRNGNRTYEAGTDLIGFLDSVYNPATMPGFSIRYDTTRKYMVADPQLYFRMFADEGFRRQYITGINRPAQHQMVLVFNTPYPRIEKLELAGIDSSKIFVEYLRPTRDSIALWLDVPSADLPDTIKGEITYFRHDSLRRLERTTAPIAAGWKLFESNDQRRERERIERERQKMIDNGETPPREPNPFKYSVEAANPLNPEKNISLTFEYPLSRIDSGRISLTRTGEGDALYRVPFHLEQDTLNIRRWTIKAPWLSGQNYKLEIPDSVFLDIVGYANDTLRSSFAVMTPEKYSTVKVRVRGKNDDAQYVLQLLDASSGRLLDEKQGARSGTYTFRYVNPGTVRLRVVEDLNGNGKWDKGNLVERLQPERVEIFVDPTTGESDIITKINWELELDADMNSMFAPLTMEQVMRDLDRQERIRVRKYLEKLEQVRKQSEQSTPERGNTFNPTDGFGI